MMPELKITQLRHFVWVAELKGFHVAAERAHRTQPAISLSIKDLEAKLGEPVFEKHKTKSAKAELTPFGKLFLPKAKELIAHHDRITQDMMLMADHKAGHIRLASVPSIASQVLPELLLEFVADAPELNVSFFDDNSDAVLKMVEKQQVDFGIASLFHEEEHPDKTFNGIWEDQIGVVCPKDHPLAEHKGVHWKTLLEHRFIRNGTSRLLEDTEASPLLGRSQFYISNMISLIAMLEAGVGITTLPRYAFPKESSTLCFIPLDTPFVVRKIGLVQLNNKSLSPAASALVDFILSKAKR
ncbi:LysR family transcriptional regulator [Pseudomonas sp. HK3]